MTTLRSFDVFDTVITRLVGEPKSLFLLVGARLREAGHCHLSAVDFARLRVTAEREAVERDPHADLFAIYGVLAALAGVGEEQATVWAKEELCAEQQYAIAVKPVAHRLETARSEGPVAFLSDMYLGDEVVANLLQRCGVGQSDDLVLVSSAERASKAEGGLYRTLSERTGVDPAAIEHFGDNEHSDVAAARRAGLRAVRCADTELNRYERLFESFSAGTDGAASVLAGCSRAARLDIDVDTQREAIIRDVSASVAAPVLYSFVAWTLRAAHERGASAVHYVSRDGQILTKIAACIRAESPWLPEGRYLYGGRQLWHTAVASMLSADERDDLRRDARRDVDPIGLFHSTSEGEWGSSPLELLEAYLRQEGIGTAEPWEVVDVGWQGRSARSLERAVGWLGMAAPVYSYVGLYRMAAPISSDRYAGFLFDHSTVGGWSAPAGFTSFVEAVCAADHGPVVALGNSDGRVVPILAREANAPALAWGLPLCHSTVLSFARFAASAMPPHPSESLVPALRAVVELFLGSPTREEAGTWGDFPFFDDQLEQFGEPIAPPMRWLDVGRRRQPSLWPAGTAARSSKLIRLAHGGARKLGGRVRR